MKTAHISYEDSLRTKAVHLESNNTLITDAPTDSHGKGEAFSPTDLVATAAVSCMMTSMGTLANNNDLQIGTMSGEVEKVMIGPPRKIFQLNIELSFLGHNLSDTDKGLLEQTAMGCPVVLSLHPDIAVNVKFRYS